MPIKISQTIQACQALPLPRLSLLLDLIPRAVLDAVLQECDCVEQRRRKLPAEWVLWLCIVMAWLPRRSLPAVMAKMWQGMSLGAPEPTAAMASASAISQARYRLGAKPLETLFKRVCRPMADPETSGAFYQGLRLVALDGTQEVVADTPANARYFGYNRNQQGASGYPQLRAVYACELGTHLIFDAVVGGCHRGEVPLAHRLLRSVQAGMLLLLDAGLSSFDLIATAQQRGAQVLARSHATRKWQPVQPLADGSFLAWMAPSNKSRDPHAAPIPVRIIRYTLDDETRVHHGKVRTLVTTLLDAQAHPARDLIVLYHERWEIEIAIDEMDTHQRLAHRPFRSLKPVGVLQEFYAFLIAYFLARLVMLRTAQHHQLDPDRLSFTHTIHLIVDALPLFELVAPSQQQALWDWLMSWIRYFQLPPRRDRSNPRVVKRQQSRFSRKRAEHRHLPQPSRPFRNAIVLLT